MTPPPLPSLSIAALSPVATAAVFCRLAGVLWATVIVKASFLLVHGEVARPIAPISLVPGDRAAGAGRSLLNARETAPHLPNAGVMLTGHACAPEGRAVPSMSVRLGLSRERPLIDKTLHVFGARASANPGAIAPFQKMPIVYERAYGGAGVWENPLGTGGPGSRVLPNIVDPKDPRKVAGFGPIAPPWAPRRALLRGLDAAALDAPVWDVPAGFDWRFFQAAPADQQLDRLHGDEWIVFDGMDPAFPRVQSRLPQVAARARRHVTGARSAATEHEIDLRADMLVIDADRLTASLVWRGRFVVESLEVLSRTRVLAGLEQPGRPIAFAASEPQPAAAASTETQEVNLIAILGTAVPFSADGESKPPPPSVPARSVAKFTGTEVVDLRTLLRQPVPFAAAAETTELPAMSGEPAGVAATIEGLAPPAAAALRFAEAAASTPAPGPRSAVLSTMQAIAVPVAETLPFAPGDPSKPSTASLARSAVERPSPLVTGTADINLAQVLKGATPFDSAERGGPTASAPASFVPGSVAVPPAPVPVPLPSAPPAPSIPLAAAKAVGATEAAEARARVMAKLARKEPFDGDDLAGANLSGLDLSGRSLARCNLRGAKLRGTKLAGANLTHAVLDEADLRGAQLNGADLSDASLIKANLERANLAKAVAARADFREAQLLGADLGDARLTNACLRAAAMHEVQAPRADVSGARFDGADLTGACLRGATAKAAVFAGAILDGCDLQQADLQEANLHKTSTRRAMLAGANLAKTSDAAPAEQG